MIYWLKYMMLFCVIATTIPSIATAQSGGDFEIVKSTFNNGGGTSSAGVYVVTGSVALTIIHSV